MKELSYKEPRYFIDVETISNVDLKKHGAMRYAQDPSTFITILHVYDKVEELSYTMTDPEFMVGDRVMDIGHINELGKIFTQILNLEEAFSAHNILFEHAILKNCLGKLFNRVLCEDDIYFGTPEEWDKAAVYGTCTKDLASIRGYKKTSLADLTESVLGGKGKSKFGHNLMMLVCKYYEEDEVAKAADKVSALLKQADPNLCIGGTYDLINNKVAHPKITQNMVDYCQKDVMAAYEVWEKLKYKKDDPQLGKFIAYALAAEKYTRQANIAGTKFDDSLAQLLVQAGKQFQEVADKKVAEVWNGLKASQAMRLKQQLGEWLPDGVENRGTGQKELEYYRSSLVGVDDELFDKIELLAECKTAAWNKAKKLLDIGVDERVYHSLQVFGTTTGRWSSRGFQLQNLPRPVYTNKEWEDKLEGFICKAQDHAVDETDKDMITSSLRPLLIPDNNVSKFFAADLSQIELRMGLYLAGDMDALGILHKEDLYLKFAQDVFGPHVKKEDNERHIGKTAILSLLYGTGTKTLKEMILSNSGANLSITKVDKIRNKFMEQFPKVVASWAHAAIKLKEALPSGKLRIKLASGRVLQFNNLKKKLVPRVGKDGSTYKTWQITYFDGITERPLHGAKLFNNIVQASATDLFIMKMVHFLKTEDHAQFRFAVHDEIVCNVSSTDPNNLLKMSWAASGSENIDDCWPGILLDSECKLMNFYFK